jgi:hypothetical protein
VKKYVVTASLLAGLSMVSGNAFAQTTGTVGANFSHIDADGGGDADSYGVNAGVSIPMGGTLAVLLDGSYTTNDDADIDTLAGTAHLITRDASTAWGGFVGLANIDAGIGDDNAWTVGGEYAKFFDTTTLAFQAAYATADDSDVDVWGLSGEYRIFADDNLRFDLGAGWARVDTGFGDGDGFQVGAGVEYRFAGSPFSIGGNVSYIDSDDLGDATTVGATLRFDFGSDSLKSRDRNGNTFGSFGGLAAFLS